jgi:F-type H+-transporting ATPase subunit alpha
LSDKLKGGSLTALPIIETEAQDISAYIPTNLISITDGQIYLSPKLFELGILPAVDVGKSVSRVGGKAQLPAYRSITGNLKLAYSQFEELETFSRFGTRLDENTRKIIEHGKRIRVCLKQNELHPMPVPEQIITLLALSGGLFDVVPVNKVQEAEAALQKIIKELPKEVLNRLLSDNDLSDTDRKIILKIAGDTLAPFKDKPEAESTSETETKPKQKNEPEPESKSASETKPKPKPKKEQEPEPDQNHK